jgi:hypothetical protein
MYSIIGLVVAIFGYAIVNFVIVNLGGGSSSSTTTTQTCSNGVDSTTGKCNP